MESVTPILEFKNTCVSYTKQTMAVKYVSAAIERNTITAIMGPSGSGKSTLLSLICADNPQSYACDISLFGRKRGTGESIWEIKKHIGSMSQKFSLYEDLTVAENIRLFAGIYGMKSEEIRVKSEKYNCNLRAKT